MTTKNKPGRPVGTTKKKTAGAGTKTAVPPGSENLAGLKSQKASEKKTDTKKRAGGLLDRSLELTTDAASKKYPYLKLSTDEKAALREANSELADMAGMQFLNDPKYAMLITYTLVFGPRIFMLFMEYRESQKQKNTEHRDKRPAEPDNSGAGEEGPGQDTSGLDAIPTADN